MDHFIPYFGKSFESITIKDLEIFFEDEHIESNRIEFKSYRPEGNINDKIKKVISSICAFLNSEGGFIIWGSPQGIIRSPRKEKIFVGSPTYVNEYIEKDKLINKISDSITPLPSGISVRVIGENSKYLYIFNIEASMIKPHQIDNKYMIRLDGQSRIAPHYYIEAMFKQIKYPDIEGFIKFGDIYSNKDSVSLRIETIIFNWSPFQNEKNVNILISSPIGKFETYNPSFYKESKYEEYGLSGHQFIGRKLNDILFYGTHFSFPDRIRFEMKDVIDEKEVVLILRFGGESSPQKESYYKFNFKTVGFKQVVNIIERDENKLISDIRVEIGMNRIEVIKKIVGR